MFGPGADGARLEGSKAYMKELAAAAGVPTARFAVFERPDDALAHLRAAAGPYVIKTDGLAAGKGVLVTSDRAAAEADVVAKLSGEAYGAAGRRVVIEEALVGREASLLAVCDGERAARAPGGAGLQARPRRRPRPEHRRHGRLLARHLRRGQDRRRGDGPDRAADAS